MAKKWISIRIDEQDLNKINKKIKKTKTITKSKWIQKAIKSKLK